MLLAALVALLASVCARAAPANTYHPSYKHNLAGQYVHSKSIAMILESIDQRLGIMEALTLEQKHQSKRLDEIKKRMELLESTVSVRLEQAELSKNRLEHRLHMLQSSMQEALEASTTRMDHTQGRIATLAQNLTYTLTPYKHLAEKVTESYRDTWRQSLVLEQLTRDGMALVNVTRRELADGLHGLARRQRETRINNKDVERAITEAGDNISKKLEEQTVQLDKKVQAVLSAQEHFLDTCHRIQRDEPRTVDTQVADVLDKLLDTVYNKTAITFQKLQVIQNDLRRHDSKIHSPPSRTLQPNEAFLKKIEQVIRNASYSSAREMELQKLTEKYIDLTNRADLALQQFEHRLNDPAEPADVDITSDADKLIEKLEHINRDEKDDEFDSPDNYDEEKYGDVWDDEEYKIEEVTSTARPHRRHLHNHPYDRGPKKP